MLPKTRSLSLAGAAALVMACALLLASLLAGGQTAQADVPAAQVARLGKDLTPMGSEKAGTKDGTIPAWTGGLRTPPAGIGYQKGKHLPDPFAKDKPLFRITGANMAKHERHLTEGQKGLLKLYDTYFMDVYPSRRSCAQRQESYDAMRRNAAVGKLVAGGNGISEAIMSSPFPIPNNGLELVWNHTLRYRGHKAQRQFTAIPVNQRGDFYLISVHDDVIFRWSNPAARRAEELDNVSFLYLLQTKAPTRLAGYMVLVQESLNMATRPRQAWTYSPGTRRVRRAPSIAYDNPGTNSDGITTADSFSGFNGAPDRFDWRVRGLEEKYVHYNGYARGLVPYKELLGKRHSNQSLFRYEKHRVWAVEGLKRRDSRHLYSRRVLYLDEDGGNVVATSIYDGRGELWRVQELGGGVQYELPLCGPAGETVYDLLIGRYLMLGLTNEEKPVDFEAAHLQEKRYTPNNMRRLSTR